MMKRRLADIVIVLYIGGEKLPLKVENPIKLVVLTKK
jgi:hypothetical protein